VQPFTFVHDDNFELDERQEKQLMVLAADNKVTIKSSTLKILAKRWEVWNIIQFPQV